MNAILPFRHQMPTMHSILHNRQSGSYHAFHPSFQVVRTLSCIAFHPSLQVVRQIACIPSFLSGCQVPTKHSILPFRQSEPYEAIHPSFQVVRSLSRFSSFDFQAIRSVILLPFRKSDIIRYLSGKLLHIPLPPPPSSSVVSRVITDAKRKQLRIEYTYILSIVNS